MPKDNRYRSLAYRRGRFIFLLMLAGALLLSYLIPKIERNSIETLNSLNNISYAEIISPTNAPQAVEVIKATTYIAPYSYIERGLPNKASGAFKTYMGHNKITNKSSDQYAMQKQAVTDKNGFRLLDGKYLVAMGTYYSDRCGKEFRVTLSSGETFEVIVGDIKQDLHTDINNQYIPANGNIIEFIVDTKVLDEKAKKLGDISCLGFEGEIIKIEEMVKNE